MKFFLITTMVVFAFVPLTLASNIDIQSHNSISLGTSVATQNVNVRNLPKADSKKIKHLLKGQSVNVKKVLGSWCQIEDKKYQSAYVDCSFLQPVSNDSLDQSSRIHYMYGVPVYKTAQGNWVLGFGNAKVTLEVFNDLQCPDCSTIPAVNFYKNYIITGKVKEVYYNLPLDYHEQAKSAAEIALCAGDQDKYFELYFTLLNNQNKWSGAKYSAKFFTDFAVGLNLNIDTLNTCLTNHTYADQIAKDIAEGHKRNIQTVPAFYINGKVYKGSLNYEGLSSAVDAALKN